MRQVAVGSGTWGSYRGSRAPRSGARRAPPVVRSDAKRRSGTTCGGAKRSRGALLLAVLAACGDSDGDRRFARSDVVSDDPDLVRGWGIAAAPETGFVLASNGRGTGVVLGAGGHRGRVAHVPPGRGAMARPTGV